MDLSAVKALVPNGSQLWSVVRSLLKLVGMYYVSKGVINDTQLASALTQVDTISGAVVILGSLAADFYAHAMARKAQVINKNGGEAVPPPSATSLPGAADVPPKAVIALLLIMAIAPALTACGDSIEQRNLKTTASIQASYGAALSVAVAYAARPPCAPGTSITVANICSQPDVVRTMAKFDVAAQAGIKNLYDQVKKDPTSPQIPNLIDAATKAVDAFKAQSDNLK